MKKNSSKNVIPMIALIAVVIALAIVTKYALSLKSRVDGQYTEITRMSQMQNETPILRTAVPAPPSPSPTVEPIPADNEQDADLADVESPYWSDGAVWIGDTYRSPTLSVDLRIVHDSKTFKKPLIYYIADVHVSDVTQIQTEAYSGDFKRPSYGKVKTMADRVNALVAISGDYCGFHHQSLVIRNGEVYRTVLNGGELCLLLRNGEMETIRDSKANVSALLKKDIWQAWEFGPALLDSNGNARRSFPGSDVAAQRNPRCCIGYIEPCHYLFFVVDGRQTVSRGLTLSELAQLMETLGCKQAYNLDGGDSAHMYWIDRIINVPSGDGRSISDIIYVAKEPYQESRFYCGKAGLSK